MHSFLTRQYRPIFTILLLIIIGLAFYVGTLQGQKSSGGGVTLACSNEVLSSLKIENNDLSIETTNTIAPTTGAYLGSKSGTKYYTPDCPGANRIKPENTVWFQTAEDATLQGYSAASC